MKKLSERSTSAFNVTDKPRRVISSYLQDKQSLGQDLELTGGVRFDRYNDFGSSLSPRAAVVYSTPIHSTLKLLYGRAFRAPSYLELYDRNNPVDFGNTDLKAETVDTIEAGYTQEMKPVTASVTLFHSRTSDLIALGEPVVHPDNPLGAPRFENSGIFSTNGLEFELKSSLFDFLTLRGTYTHFFDSDPFPSYRDFGSMILNFAQRDFNIDVDAVFRQKFEELPNQGSYALLNAAIEVPIRSVMKPAPSKLSLVGRVENILDTDYTTESPSMSGGVPNRGRAFWVGLRADF